MPEVDDGTPFRQPERRNPPVEATPKGHSSSQSVYTLSLRRKSQSPGGAAPVGLLVIRQHNPGESTQITG